MINTFNPDNATKSASNPLAYGLTMFAAAVKKIRSVMIIGLAIVETGSIYCFIIALLLIFV